MLPERANHSWFLELGRRYSTNQLQNDFTLTLALDCALALIFNLCSAAFDRCSAENLIEPRLSLDSPLVDFKCNKESYVHSPLYGLRRHVCRVDQSQRSV